MVSFKVVIGTKQGKCYQREIADPDASNLLGKKLGDTVSGDSIGLKGYEFLITGGSDYCGIPMRKDVSGAGRKRVLAVQDIGMKKIAKGIRKRRSVCGNTIHPKISQVNLKVLKEGKEKLGGEEAPKTEEKKAEAPKEAKAEKPVEKKEAPEKKAEVPKEEEKAEAKPEAPKKAEKEAPKAEKVPKEEAKTEAAAVAAK